MPPTARHRSDFSSELCCLGVNLQRWASPLATRLLRRVSWRLALIWLQRNRQKEKPRNSSNILCRRQLKIKSSLISCYYAKACNEWLGPSLRLGAWITQLKRNVAAVLSHWRHCVRLPGQGFEPKTFRVDSNVLSHYADWSVRSENL